jgi:hypothetical protein
MTLVVEPLGEIYPLAPGESKSVTEWPHEALNEPLEIIQEKDSLTICGALTGFSSHLE